MLTQKKSCESKPNGTIAAMRPPRYSSATRRHGRRPSAGSGASGGGADGTSVAAPCMVFARSTLLTESHLFCAHLAKQPGRTNDQHREEDQEPDRLLQLWIDIETGEGFDEADDHSAKIRPCNAAEPSEHDDGERREDEIPADARRKRVDGRQQYTPQPGERRP